MRITDVNNVEVGHFLTFNKMRHITKTGARSIVQIVDKDQPHYIFGSCWVCKRIFPRKMKKQINLYGLFEEHHNSDEVFTTVQEIKELYPEDFI